MKRKILTLISVVIAAVITAGGLTACAPPHRYEENWSYNEEEHWKNVTCIHAPYVEVVREKHSFDGNFCTVCGYYKITEGLSYNAVYDLDNEIIEYHADGCGSADRDYIGVPATYKGKPVTQIGNGIFSRARELVVPKTVTAIDTGSDKANINYSLKHITVVPENGKFASQDGILYNKAKTEILFIPRVSGSVTVPDGVMEIPYAAFFDNKELTEISIPESVINVEPEAFTGCNKLRYSVENGLKYLRSGDNPHRILVGLEGYGQEGYTIHNDTKIIAGGTFQATDITNISIPEGVINICAYSFNSCQNLTQVTLPESLKTIGQSAFYNCPNLQKIKIPSGLESFGENCFNGCPELEFTEYDNACYIGNDENPTLMLFKANDNYIRNCTVSATTKFIYDNAFSYCGWLTEVNLADSVKVIGVQAFQDCEELQSIVLPDGITELKRNAFYDCYSLNSVKLPANLTSIGRSTFSSCRALEEISLPESLKKIENFAFEYCNKLKHIEVPDSVEYIGRGAFRGCYNFESLTLPFVGTSRDAALQDKLFGLIFGSSDNSDIAYYNIKSVTVSGGTVGAYAFSYCNNIKSIVLKGVTEIGYAAFNVCESLTDIDLGDSLTSIGEAAFFNCRSLTEITIPEGVKNILPQTFNYCNKLNKITLPLSLKSIGKNSFVNCDKLKDVYYNGTISQWNAVQRDTECGIKNSNTMIHCKNGDTVCF